MLRECRSSCIRDSRVEPSSVEKVETEVEEEGGAAVAEFIVGLSLIGVSQPISIEGGRIDLRFWMRRPTAPPARCDGSTIGVVRR
jgi:hypothetical protein